MTMFCFYKLNTSINFIFYTPDIFNIFFSHVAYFYLKLSILFIINLIIYNKFQIMIQNKLIKSYDLKTENKIN